MHQNRSVVFSGPTAEERTGRSFGRLITRRCCPECLSRCAAQDKQGRPFFQCCGDKSADFVDRGPLMSSNDTSLRAKSQPQLRRAEGTTVTIGPSVHVYPSSFGLGSLVQVEVAKEDRVTEFVKLRRLRVFSTEWNLRSRTVP